MSDAQPQTHPQAPQVAVTLQLDREVYEFFLEKAQKADVGIESYLASTLSIVLGCKAFNKMSVCSPQPMEEIR
ncbi:MAG: hypothetical protein WCK63_07150 [Betaproteobacteria bacterium]